MPNARRSPGDDVMNHTRRTLFTGALLLGAALATGSAAAQNERSFTSSSAASRAASP
jgi:hypothetical protein